MRDIFVFGANLAGRHGAGAARHAFDHYGARWGQGRGLQGDSYALPTKDRHLLPLPLKDIEANVREFLVFAAAHPEYAFKVTRVGCGLAGHKDEDIAPMFKGAPGNVTFFEPGWERYR